MVNYDKFKSKGMYAFTMGSGSIMRKFSLQTKILTLILSLIIFVTFSLTGIDAYMQIQQTEKNMGQRALQVATTISFMPTVKNAFKLDDPSSVIQPIAEKIRKKVGAEFIVVGNLNSVRYSHPEPFKIGRTMVGGDNNKALIYGEYYTSKAVGSLGPSLRGKAPIFGDYGEIIGIVSVGFLIEDVQTVIFDKLVKTGSVATIILIIGIFGGILLTKNIRKETLGLEPHQIAAMYRERSAILRSIKEGIIAIDQNGYITMMNDSAKEMLGIEEECLNKKIEDVFSNTRMYNVLITGKTNRDEEMLLRNRIVIVNRTPITENGEVTGVVSTFRDKTEIQQMLNTLSEMKQYSEDLRAQTHEYTNKLYVLSGLLQLEHYKEAIGLIQLESKLHKHQTQVLLELIKDRTVQAILLGKIGKASEKKVTLQVDSLSSINTIPTHVAMNSLITILGNLLDNAIEAASEAERKEVIFFTTDEGNDIVFEVADSGLGIQSDLMPKIFNRGFSTKGKAGHGYGLSAVLEAVHNLQGTVEIHNQPDSGAVFTVFLPKQLRDKDTA